MTISLVLGIVFLVLFVLLAIRVPITMSLGTAGLIGIVLITGSDVAGSTLEQLSFSVSSTFELSVVPMFILLGTAAQRAGLARDAYGLIAVLLGRFRSAIPLTTIAASGGFAAVTGSSVGTVAALASTTMTEMKRHGYSRKFAAGTLATAGTLGILIPPSISLVMYGIITGEPIGQLLIAGILPGILTMAGYAATVILIVKFMPSFAFASQSSKTDTLMSSKQDVGSAVDVKKARVTRQMVSGTVAIAAIFIIVIGSVFTGLATVTESAAIGALVAIIMLIARVRFSEQTAFQQGIGCLKESANMSGMLLAILFGAGIFSYFLVLSGVPSEVGIWASSLSAPAFVIMAVLLLTLVPLGMFLDGLSILLITAPIFYEVASDLGFNGIWLGIMFVKFIEVGLITPPVGMNAFVIAGATPGMSANEVFRGITPFYAAELVIISVLFALPSISTVLPGMM